MTAARDQRPAPDQPPAEAAEPPGAGCGPEAGGRRDVEHAAIHRTGRHESRAATARGPNATAPASCCQVRDRSQMAHRPVEEPLMRVRGRPIPDSSAPAKAAKSCRAAATAF